MGKLKFIPICLLIFSILLCGCASETENTDTSYSGQAVTENTDTSAYSGQTVIVSLSTPSVPPTPSIYEVPEHIDWNIEVLNLGIEYLEDDGINGKGIMINLEIRDYDNIGFYAELFGAGLEYYNGKEWETICEYAHRDTKMTALPQEKLDYAFLRESIMLRRWDERLPDGKYRLIKLIWDGANNEKYVSMEFEVKKPI